MSYESQILDRLMLKHPNARCELEFNSTFELLVAVILSAQCTDKRVNMATKKLFQYYNTPKALASLSLEELKPFIYSLGFFNNKAKNLLEMSNDIVNRFNGEVPNDFESLISLSGVGRKTASVVLSIGFNVPAMPVDTHVYRVARRLGLSDGNTADKVEADLKSKYDSSLWNNLHNTMIFHGRYVCHSRNPDCKACNLQEFCQYYKSDKELSV